MIHKLVLTLALATVIAAPTLAQEDVQGMPGMHPEVILGPPEGFEPPEMPEPPPMDMPPEEMQDMMVEMFFQMMDANGDGSVDFDEFRPWVRGAHMPPPEMMHGDHGMMGDDGMMGDPGMMGDDGMMGDPGMMGGPGMMHEGGGMLIAGEGDLADLPMAPECSDDLRNSELDPQAENSPCGDREGNLIFRTICNMPGFESQAISLPDGRGAGCFGLEALRGEIAFEIISEDGRRIFDTSMGKAAFMALKLEGPGVFTIKSLGGSPDGGVTVRFTDVPLD